ncbi:DUF4123 domain-containing protein [Pseudomonas frederiksbergensis]|uniref:DUF4123 domain-containing protein n=1 Tax=Pseudomonas frederiksbergensis TaxID=104087 RepID=A0A423HQ12_9PSED|nr:DUF4123 domain-containing protein [Pseudomonas frederiksbergensis]RON15309.1 hypothetical protein BK662_14485 [Pseudomonas frederiksbergensis]
MPPDALSPHTWLERQPLKPSEQLFAIFSSASAAEPFKAWKRSITAQAPSPIWADTAYAEWEAVMPYVGIVAADSEFLEWVATTEARDWGWLAVSSASQEVLVEHLRSLTQVLLSSGNAVFFRFWDGRYLLSILQSADVNATQLMPVIDRCLINGQALDIGGSALKAAREFPWWDVSESLLKHLSTESATTRINNLMKWLSEDRPDLYEAFSERVLRHKVAIFLQAPDLPQAPKSALVDYLISELD